MVLPPDPAAGVTSVLDYLEQTLQDCDADITHRGEGFFEFKVPIAARLVRDLTLRFGRRSWTPLSFVSAGSLSATPLRDLVVVSADVRISQYLLTRVAVFGLVTGALSAFGGPILALVVGVSAGLGMGAVCYALAQWEFGSWLKRLDRLLRDGPRKRGRLTSA